MALLEAMAARLPIVTTQVGIAIDALTHEESAIFVGKRDAPAIVDAVARLDGDQALRGRLGDAAHAVALTYRADDRTRELANWIQRLG
jgi:glycosyltransferase involved in cell wall biosynthesis